MKLEEAIKECKSLIRVFRNCIPEEEPDNINSAKTIETVLQGLEKLKGHCKELIKEKQALTTALENSISKEKIKDRIEKNNKKIYGSAFISTRYENKLKMENVILQELLED